MNIAQREQQIIRIQSQSSYASINEALVLHGANKSTIQAANGFPL